MVVESRVFIAPASGARAIEGWAVALVAVVLAVVWTLMLGPDINVDFLSYHLYIGMHAGGDALAGSYFPSGASSYLLPYAHWPLAAMIGAGWPARVVGGVLAVIYSLAAIATWFVALQLFPGRSAIDSASRIAATIIGVLSPLVLAAIGSSHVDLLTAIPALAGVGLMLKSLAARRQRAPWMLLAGACLGAATALKLTNAQFALAAGLTVAVAMLYRRDVTFGQLLALTVGGLAGFVLAYGYWGILLYREFGNPVFPFFDAAFQVKADGAASASVDSLSSFATRLWTFRDGLHQRFLPHGWSEWLLRPLYMVDSSSNLYAEVRAPDARFLVLFLLAPFALWKLRRREESGLLAPLLLFLAFGWVLWMTLFGNGRYMLPLALAAGPALMASGRILWSRSAQWLWVSVAILAAVQSILLIESGRFRWTQSAWQERWIDARLPKEVTDTPALFVVLTNLSASWLSLFVHPQSQFVNPDAISIQPKSPAIAARVPALLASAKSLVFVYVYSQVDADTGAPVPATPAELRPLAERYGLVVDFSVCRTGELLQGLKSLSTRSELGGKSTSRKSISGYFFCPARYDPDMKTPPVDPVVEAAFDNLERACPGQLPAGSTSTVCQVGLCWRGYPATDAFVAIDEDGGVRMRRFGGFEMPYLGQAADLAKGAAGADCHADLGKHVPWNPGANLLSTPSPK